MVKDSVCHTRGGAVTAVGWVVNVEFQIENVTRLFFTMLIFLENRW